MPILMVLLSTPTMAADCTGQPPISVAVSADRAMHDLYEGNAGAATEEVGRTHAAMECQRSLIEPKDLALLYQVGGSAALKAGDTLSATRWFREAALRTPDIPFDPNFGNNAAAVFASTQAQVGTPKLRATQTKATIWVDGVSYAPGQLVIARPSEHAVQYVDAEGRVQTIIVDFSESNIPTLPGVPLRKVSSRGPAARRVLGASMVTLGVGSMAGLVFANGYLTNRVVNGEIEEYPQAPLIAWGVANSAVTFGGLWVMRF